MVGYVRCGAQDLASEFKFKEGDSAGHVLHAETTDKILLFADNGRFYTLSVINCREVAVLVSRLA